MSRYHDKLEELIEDLSNNDIVNLYNEYAEANYYEKLYHMSDFDEIVGTNRSYSEVDDEIDDDFNKNDDYFYCDSGTGYFTSTDDPMELCSASDLIPFVIDNEGCGYDELESFFDGYLFEEALETYFKEISPSDILQVIRADSGLESDEPVKDVTKEEQKSCLAGVKQFLIDLSNEYECDNRLIYSLPKGLQEIWWDFHEADIDYAKKNRNFKGALPATEAIEIAGFKKGEKGYWMDRHEYNIKIQDDVIKSVTKVREPKRDRL